MEAKEAKGRREGVESAACSSRGCGGRAACPPCLLGYAGLALGALAGNAWAAEPVWGALAGYVLGVAGAILWGARGRLFARGGE